MAGIGNGDFHLLVIVPVMASLSSGNLPGGGNAYLLVIFPAIEMFIYW